MIKNGVDIEEVRLFVVDLFPPGDCIPQSPTDLTEVFEAITHHGLWDSVHYSPLVRIVQTFGAGDPEMMAWIENYKNDLKAYALVARIEDYIESNLDPFTDQPQVYRAKYDPRYNWPVEWKINFVDHSLQHLTNVWELFSVLYLGPDSPPTALLDHVYKDCTCISVTWIIPVHLIPKLKGRVTIDPVFFQKHRILTVIVKDEICCKEMVSTQKFDQSCVGVSPSEPHTSVTSLRSACVCLLVCLDLAVAVNFKSANFTCT